MKSREFTHQVADLRSTLQVLSRKFTKDREDSLDLVQDTMVKALVYRHKFVQDTNLRGWLFTIMRNTYINNYKKDQRVRILHGESKEPYFQTIEDPHTFSLPDSSFEYKEIWKHIDALKDEYSIPFKMHTSGYKYQEIAEHLSIPIGTVKNRIHTARQEIQKRMAGY
jgi:RNA polymerase sigma factor (sigma-70 family)